MSFSSPPRLWRRSFLVGALASTALAGAPACKREERCKTCGMRIDPKSAWYSELASGGGQTASFDTPRCALIAWRSGKVPATGMRVHEYYDASGPLRDAATLRFILGGDVAGPMGADLVPVDPSRASKFIQDHGADRALTLAEITQDVLSNLK